MGKVKAWYMEEIENMGGNTDEAFGAYMDSEVWAMRCEQANKKLKDGGDVVRDEYDLWVTHDGEGDN